MTAPRRQLPLPLPQAAPPPSPFLAAPCNAAALSWLARPDAWPGGRLLLVAEPGAGKTHLLGAWAADHAALLVAGATLELRPETPAAMAIDDADQAPEAALLHTMNAAAEAGGRMLLSARQPAAQWAVQLPDLASRLRAVLCVEIGPPDDSHLAALLGKLLADRQLAVPQAQRDWLLRHLPRTPAAMRAAVLRLEKEMAPGTRVTHALVAAVAASVVELQDG